MENYSLLPKNEEELYRYAGCLYSHKEQKGMLKCEYMWKHHISGKSGKTTVWVSCLEHLAILCEAWRNNFWYYLPLTFKR